jgi:enediyne biosynthesis protein E5
VEMILRLNEVVYAPFYALFLVGPTALIAEQLMAVRGSRSVSS